MVEYQAHWTRIITEKITIESSSAEEARKIASTLPLTQPRQNNDFSFVDEEFVTLKENKMQAQLTPEQAQELYDFLEGPDGCDFQQSDPEDAKTASWLCDGTLTKTYAWLDERGIDRSAMYWHAKCDCEVVFNMPRDLLPGKGEQE